MQTELTELCKNAELLIEANKKTAGFIVSHAALQRIRARLPLIKLRDPKYLCDEDVYMSASALEEVPEEFQVMVSLTNGPMSQTVFVVSTSIGEGQYVIKAYDCNPYSTPRLSGRLPLTGQDIKYLIGIF